MSFAILAGLHLLKHNPHRSSHYVKYIDKINKKGIELPLRAMDVAKLERQNDFTI